MRIIVVVDLSNQASDVAMNEGLQPDFKKIKQKLPAGIEYLYCGGHNAGSATMAQFIALHYRLNVRIDNHLEDIEKIGEDIKKNSKTKIQPLKHKIYEQEAVSLSMFHLQEFMHSLKSQNRNHVLIVANEFVCQLLLTYALGISIDAVHAFNINAGSVILLDIHDMISMNKIHF